MLAQLFLKLEFCLFVFSSTYISKATVLQEGMPKTGPDQIFASLTVRRQAERSVKDACSSKHST